MTASNDHCDIVVPVEQPVDIPPPPRIPFPPPDSGFTLSSMQGGSPVMPQPHVTPGPSGYHGCHVQTNQHLTMRQSTDPPIVLAKHARVKVAPVDDANGQGLADLGHMPGGVTGHEQGLMAHAAQQFVLEQPFQDLGGQYINSEDLGSWRSLVSHGDQEF